MDDLNILKHPLVTEKAVNMIEDENKLTFVVDKNATKPTIKGAVESLYKVRVKKVSILNDMKARKRAIVTLNKEFKASDIATKLGVI
ncbi:MAG TPA: 50S ribosomal protein L23 [archaeon]|nr:50S ribosomal protein L23 [archaeon]